MPRSKPLENTVRNLSQLPDLYDPYENIECAWAPAALIRLKPSAV